MIGRRDRDQGRLFYEFKLDEVIPNNRLLRRMNVDAETPASIITHERSRTAEVHQQTMTVMATTIC